MAKVTVNESTCVGCGLCVSMCPDCFEMADGGVAKAKDSECTSCNPQDIAAQCPVDAISVEE
ncbi:MAG: ferredoxin [Candidatus Omnitrophica bacterium]|nr:ferredoxin [Candidatus Omnitrophota bacterium]